MSEGLQKAAYNQGKSSKNWVKQRKIHRNATIQDWKSWIFRTSAK